jgi:hypothetical protein
MWLLINKFHPLSNATATWEQNLGAESTLQALRDTAIFRHRMHHELEILPLAFSSRIGTRIKRTYEAIQTMHMIIHTNNKLMTD